MFFASTLVALAAALPLVAASPEGCNALHKRDFAVAAVPVASPDVLAVREQDAQALPTPSIVEWDAVKRATTSIAGLVTQIADGQPQAPTSGAGVPSKPSGAGPSYGESPHGGPSHTSKYVPTYTGSHGHPSAPAVANAAVGGLQPFFVLPNIFRRSHSRKNYAQLLRGRSASTASAATPGNALTTSGFSICDGNLALGGQSVWWRCLSGSFYNLYDRYIASQCSPINLRVVELEQC